MQQKLLHCYRLYYLSLQLQYKCIYATSWPTAVSLVATAVATEVQSIPVQETILQCIVSL